MVTDEQRYKAYTFNIAGFALMTPLGKIVLEYFHIFRDIGPLLFALNLLLSFLLFIGGLTLVDRDRILLEGKEGKFYANKPR